MERDKQIILYQRKTWKEYKKVVGLPVNYSFIYGNPVKVHVPVDTAIKGLMIIGAYPTAHFNVIGSLRDVPVSDHLYPFSNEVYFDGSSINRVKSGKEIEEYFLKNLGFTREQCWITDLVKVFLFKEGHIKKYETLGFKGHKETRSLFKQIADKSKVYIDSEIQLAQPRVILGLGAEVNSTMLSLPEKGAIEKMAEAKFIDYKLNGQCYCYFPIAHPGILMRGTEGSLKWRGTLDKAIENIKECLKLNSQN